MVSSKLLKSNSPTGWTKTPYRAKKNPDFFPCVIMANDNGIFIKEFTWPN